MTGETTFPPHHARAFVVTRALLAKKNRYATSSFFINFDFSAADHSVARGLALPHGADPPGGPDAAPDAPVDSSVAGSNPPLNSAAQTAPLCKASALQKASSSVAAGTSPDASPSAGGSVAPNLLPPADILHAKKTVAFAAAGRGGTAKSQADKKASTALESAVASAAVDSTATAGRLRAESVASCDSSAPNAQPLYASARSQAVGRISQADSEAHAWGSGGAAS